MTVAARFRLERGDFTLDAELAAPGRGVTAIFGRSGAGKTTLLRAIAGLERCPGGFLSVDGEIWQDGDRFVPVHRRRLGYVFQESSLFAHLSVRRNLEYGWTRVPAEERRLDPQEAAAWLGVAAFLERRPTELSAGERQRVAIARALLAGPSLLLMDEPLASLDRQSKAEILPFLDRIQADLDIPVLYVSHSLDEVARIAGHMAWMEKGRVRAEGPVAELLTRLDLPLAQGPDAEALIEVTVAGHDDEDQLTRLDFGGGRLLVARRDLAPGARVALRVQARDVSLTLERQESTSILNIFPARVSELRPDGPAEVIVRLDAGGVPILSRVTRRSARALDLAPGLDVWAQIKSVAVLS